MYTFVVLQVSSRGKLLATILLLADEGLLAVVSPHVNLQPLQHVEALPAALCAAPEHSVIPVCFEVIFEMSRPGERPAATLKRAAEDLLGERAAGPRRELSLVPVCCQTVRVVT